MKTPKKTKSPYISVRKSKIHGTGVYAKKDIEKGTRVIEYVGEKVTKKESDRRARKPLLNNADDEDMGAVYLFEINKKYDLDGYVKYNTARFINHSCEPNCESDIIKGHIWIVAIKNIKKGTEISYNYNYSWEDYEDHPCYCGSKRCVGFILADEHWPRLKRKLKKKKSRIGNKRSKSAGKNGKLKVDKKDQKSVKNKKNKKK